MSEFKSTLVKGTFYIAIAKYSGIAAQIIISAVLARLLHPSDFGLLAIASVIIAFFNILSNVGIGPAIIQRKDLSKYQIDQLFSFTLHLGFLLALIFFCLSWPIAHIYGQEELRPICQILSILILCTCASTVSQNILYKEKQFKFVAFTNLFVQIGCGILAIVAALSGLGVYSLVLSQVAGALITNTIFLVKRPRKYYFKQDWTPVKSVFSYSAYNFLATLANYVTMNLDKLLVGKFIGPTGLGYYEKSYRLMFMPIQNITFVVEPVLHPLFSEIQNDFKQIAHKYLKLLKSLAYASFSIAIVLSFCAKELILLFFGSQWGAAVLPFQVMALSVGVQMLSMTCGAMFNACNATKQSFIGAVIMGSLMGGSYMIAILIWKSIVAVAWGFLISQTIAGLVNLHILFHVIKTPMLAFYKAIAKPVIVASGLAVIYLLFNHLALIDNMFASLVLKGTVFMLYMFLALIFVERINLFNVLVNMIKNKM